MSGYPHRIRLFGPWECEPLDPPLPMRRFIPPARLRDAGLANFVGRVRLVRRFGYPGRIDSYEHVWLTFADIAGQAAVTLNDQPLGAALTGARAFEITALLGPRNRLEVTLEADSNVAGLPGEIALEIRRDAFLRAVTARRDAVSAVHISGLVVGTSVQPLELYALADRKNVGYAVINARAEGQVFTLSFTPEIMPPDVRLELVCVAECWYAVEVPIEAVDAQHP